MHVGTSKAPLRAPLAQSDLGAAPNPNDEEHMDAGPDQEEMEEAINNFLLLVEKQEKKSFKDLATILSQLPKPAQGSIRSIVRGRCDRGRFSELFSKRWIQITPIRSLRWSGKSWLSLLSSVYIVLARDISVY